MDTLFGVLERLTYHNEENGYTVGRLAVEGARDLVTIVGSFSNPVVGEQFSLEGQWSAHREFGRQFAVERYSVSRPATAFAIEKYLGSGLIKGVGPVMAKRMVELFSTDTLEIIENEPRKLLRVEGIGEKRVAMIQKAWHEQREIRNVMLFLQGKGVSATFAVKIYKTYGDKSLAVVEENPYRLAQDIFGIGFKTADKIAQQLGIALDSERRLEAGLLYTLSEATDFGHLYLPEPKLIASSAEILGIDVELLPPVLEQMIASEAVISEDDPTLEMAGRALRLLYHPALYYTEIGLAAQIRRRIAMELTSPISRERITTWLDKQQEKSGMTFAEEQREAVALALENRVFVLTGGPGCGKCVAKGTLTLSANGIVPIETFWKGNQETDAVHSMVTTIAAKDGLAQTQYVYRGGQRETIQLRSHLGVELEATPNHRVWAMTPSGPDWKRMDALEIGDYIAVRRGDDLWGSGTTHPEVGYLLGVMCGDGWLNSKQTFSITNNDTELLLRCQAIIQQHFGVLGHINPTRRTFDLRVHSITLRQTLLDMGVALTKSEAKVIPHSVLTAPKATVLAFLAGLYDTDGCVHVRESGYVHSEITLKSETLIRQMQTVLLNLGIVSRIAAKHVMYRYHERSEQRTYWRLILSGENVDRFLELVPTKKTVPAQKRRTNPNRDIVPLSQSIIRELFQSDGKRTRREWWVWKREIAGTRQATASRIMDLLQTRHHAVSEGLHRTIEEACRPCYYWDKVTHLAPSHADVYDLNIPEEASFVANGLVNHNTTITNLIAKAFDARKLKVVLVSPTGRAAKRLAEVTGREAQTIHRLLKFDPATRNFQYNDTNPYPCDVLIADEVSMLDAVLANNLLKAIPEHAQIVFVGDSDQLPSVGAGNVLGDMLASGVVPSIKLMQVFRQAQESLIVTNAHRIREGKSPVLVPPKERGDKNCLFVNVEEGLSEEDNAAVNGAEQVIKLVRKSLPMLGYRGDDIQVLSPMHKGTLGVGYLNELLQEALNPADPTGRNPELLRGSRRFRIGDRVIQLVNNYDKNVYNGDVGVIADIKPDDQLLLVRYGETTIEYDYADYDEMQLAYAISIHKSQGSEYRAVVLICHSSQYMMLQRNLLYTGMTRARDLCILVGDKRAIGRAVNNNKTTRRFTRLAERLRETDSDTLGQLGRLV